MGPPQRYTHSVTRIFFLAMMWHNHLITIKHDQHISNYIKMQMKLVGFLLLHTSWTHIPSYSPCFLNQPPCIPITISWIQVHSWCVTCTPRPWLRRALTCGPFWSLAKYACATGDQKAPNIKSLNVMNMIIVKNLINPLLRENYFPLFCPSFRSFRLDSASVLVLRFLQLRLVRLEKLIVKGEAQERRHPAEPTIHFTIAIISVVIIHPTMHVDR